VLPGVDAICAIWTATDKLSGGSSRPSAAHMELSCPFTPGPNLPRRLTDLPGRQLTRGRWSRVTRWPRTIRLTLGIRRQAVDPACWW
jgi:hypothetical protein